ncbi:MAG: radical SAM protein [Dysgonamonadaceae bacterium]|nr:radical SAM protein [Dysgonamonadaceae bacterium]
MNISKYNHVFKSNKYGYLLYIGETNSFAKIDENLYVKLKEIEASPEKIEDLDTEIKQVLSKARYFVSDQGQILYEKRFAYYQKAWDTTNLGLVIAPTRGCNFNCPYCYEENKPAIHMTRKVEEDIIKFIQKHQKVEILNVTWYGGEPLLKFDSIQRLLKDFKTQIHPRIGIHSMTSNGYLLDEEKCKFFQEYPMTSIQITIDGNKEIHDKRRTLIPNIPTYDKIVENVDRFIFYNPTTFVNLRVNLDSSNIHIFPEVLKEFDNKWWNHGKKVIAYPAFVRDYSESCTSNCLLVKRIERMDLFEELYRQYGYDVRFLPEFCVGGCGATVINYYIVGPEGELYKCWNDLGVKKQIVGYLNSDEIINFELLARYMAGPTMMDSHECIECKLLPTCEGGCIWEKHKNLFEGRKYDYLCNTRKDSIDRALELHYEKMIKQQQKQDYEKDISYSIT